MSGVFEYEKENLSVFVQYAVGFDRVYSNTVVALANKYGQEYIDYKMDVNPWFPKMSV